MKIGGQRDREITTHDGPTIPFPFLYYGNSTSAVPDPSMPTIPGAPLAAEVSQMVLHMGVVYLRILAVAAAGSLGLLDTLGSLPRRDTADR